MMLLPFLSLIAWSWAFNRHGRGWTEAAVASLVVFGVTVSLGTELQSLAGILTTKGSVLVWAVSAGLGLLYGRRARTGETAPNPGSARAAILDAAPLVVLLGLTAAVALISAPNSYDGLGYHLTRVEAWSHQGSIQPYAAHDTRQLFMPSWPEYAILQFRLLSDSDRFANLVQWLGFAGACGGAAVLARALGGGPAAAIAAASLVATLPMAVAQASGTQTDLVAASWAVATCAFGYRALSGPGRPSNVALSALSLGLALATKQTAVLFAGVALLPALFLIWRATRATTGAWLVAMLLAVALIAGPQMARNRAVFGNLRGDRALIETVVMTTKAPHQVFVNMVRNVTVHFGTPWSGINQWIVERVRGLSGAIGVDPDDSRTTWGTKFGPVPWNTHEEAAPNPLHLLLLLACAFGLMRARRGAMPRVVFVAALMASFVIFCASLKWQFYGSRLHTPLFVLALAWAAVELERAPATVRRAVLLLLMLAALPGALWNYTRPLVAPPKGRVTPRPTLLAVPRNLHYFNYSPELARPHLEVALRIADSGCEDVGVRGQHWEYAVRALVHGAGSEARFRNVDVQNASARFMVQSGPPCLLLQMGWRAGTRPAWAEGWKAVVDHSALGIRGIALFAPR
jgi:hypothetical protein